MKILHLISGGDVGGAKTHVLSLLEGLNRSETVHLVCFMEGEFAAEARVLGIPTTVVAGSNPLKSRKRILAMIRHDGYEIIHCHGAKANMLGALLRKKAGIPVVSTVHSDYRLDYMGRPLAALTYGNINKIALRKFDAWVGVSHGMTELLTSRGFDPQRLYPLYNGVDFSHIPPVVSREEYLKGLGLEVQEDTVVYGIAARINPVKDMETLVRAFAQAVKECPNIRLVIAGEGEQEALIRGLAKELCPENTVFFAGWVKDMYSFYNALDVNLLTSLSETFPYALTEGSRMGCATISSRVGGVPYLIDDGINGFLFEPRDVNTLAGHMVRLAKDSDLRRQMGRDLQEKTRREFSLEAMVEKQKQIYAAILRRTERLQRKRDGVVICGAYGRGNCGDNAILNAIVQQLRQVDPDLPITALSRKPAQTKQIAGVNAVYTFHIFRIGRLLRKSQLYISGGGTLMQDATSTRSLLYYLYSIRQAAKNGCKVMLYGCGVGPISRGKNRKRTATTLNRYAHKISVRDEYSLDFLKELQVTKPEISLTADPALLMEAPTGGPMQTYLRSSGIAPEKRYIMFALRPWEGFREKIQDFADACNYAYETYGLTPLLYAMEPRRDEAANAAVAEKLRCPFVQLSAGRDGRQALALVKQMEAVVSMRLHSLIFAAGQGVPVVGVVYDPKVSGFLDYLGQKLYLPLEKVTAEDLKTLIDRALTQKTADETAVERLRSLAEENPRLAKELLES
ncbi:MAG: polysaccharide pyruvyl transferase CsaB [Oscillospiraceae bacterium]|nr:polysaccharide pyruvyl transferase CsaB [Oscillospiraceae bacterium]